jgi:DNA-binding transcriptional MerR regulator
MKSEIPKGISALARESECSEDTIRRLDRRGVISLKRDTAGRRLGTARDVAAVRAHLANSKAP